MKIQGISTYTYKKTSIAMTLYYEQRQQGNVKESIYLRNIIIY